MEKEFQLTPNGPRQLCPTFRGGEMTFLKKEKKKVNSRKIPEL